MDWFSDIRLAEATDHKEDLEIMLRLLDEDRSTSSQASLYLKMKFLLLEKTRVEKVDHYLESKLELIEALTSNVPTEIREYINGLILKIEERDIDFLSALFNNFPTKK